MEQHSQFKRSLTGYAAQYSLVALLGLGGLFSITNAAAPRWSAQRIPAQDTTIVQTQPARTASVRKGVNLHVVVERAIREGVNLPYHTREEVERTLRTACTETKKHIEHVQKKSCNYLLPGDTITLEAPKEIVQTVRLRDEHFEPIKIPPSHDPRDYGFGAGLIALAAGLSVQGRNKNAQRRNEKKENEELDEPPIELLNKLYAQTQTPVTTSQESSKYNAETYFREEAALRRKKTMPYQGLTTSHLGRTIIEAESDIIVATDDAGALITIEPDYKVSNQRSPSTSSVAIARQVTPGSSTVLEGENADLREFIDQLTASRKPNSETPSPIGIIAPSEQPAYVVIEQDTTPLDEPQTIPRILSEEEKTRLQPGAHRRHPEAEVVQEGEGHVARTDLQRHDVVHEAGHQRHRHEKDHDHAVGREDLVVVMRR